MLELLSRADTKQWYLRHYILGAGIFIGHVKTFLDRRQHRSASFNKIRNFRQGLALNIGYTAILGRVAYNQE